MTSIILKTLSKTLRLSTSKSWLPSPVVKSFRSTLVLCHTSRRLSTIPQALDETSYDDTRIREGENLFIHNKFHVWPDYKTTVYDPSHWNSPESWVSSPPILRQIKEIVEQSITRKALMDPSLDQLRQSIVDEISSMPDDELLRLLYGLSLFQPERTSHTEYKKFWKVLDSECCKRLPKWDMETLFKVDDLLYLLSFGRSSEFHYLFTKKICRRLEKGKREHYVRSMFVLNITRALPAFMSAFELEFVMKNLIEELTAEEVATVCIALFKTSAKIQSVTLIEKIVEKITAEANTLHPILIGGVAKYLRFTGKIEVSEQIQKFQEAFLPELNRIELSASLHLALAGTTSTTFNPQLVTRVKDKFESQLDKTRLKELERILLVLTMFNVEAESFYQKAASEVQEERRTSEIEQYGKCLPPILYYLSLRGIYIHSLIDKIFRPEFLLKYYGRNMAKYQREIACLDFSVGFNCPDYTGARLTDKTRQKITKLHIFYANPLNATRITGHMGFLRQVVLTSSIILGGDKFVHWCNILPQNYTAELVFCLDENNYPVQIPQSFREIPDYDVKWIPNGMSNVTFHAISVCNRGSCVHKTGNLVGQKLEQLKQITKMGYKVHTIVALDWQTCEHEPEQQKELLMKKVFKQTLNPKLLKSSND